MGDTSDANETTELNLSSLYGALMSNRMSRKKVNDGDDQDEKLELAPLAKPASLVRGLLNVRRKDIHGHAGADVRKTSSSECKHLDPESYAAPAGS